MKENYPIKNKPVGFFGLGFSILFILLGFYLFTQSENYHDAMNPILLKGLGIACILFFGALLALKLLKLLKRDK